MFFVLSLFLNFAHAQEMSVWAQDPEAARKIYTGKNVKFEDAQSERETNAQDGYLTPSKRDAVLHGAGFDSIVKKMDAFEKDLLVMTAHASDVDDLRKAYPKIKAADLAKLKVAVDAAVAK